MKGSLRQEKHILQLTEMGCRKLSYYEQGELEQTALFSGHVLEKNRKAEKNRVNYYPYGMAMVGRNSNISDYRFGFGGQEMDNELSGDGNMVSYKLRLNDPRLGRWFSPDPYNQFNSPYSSMANSPSLAYDGDGGYVYVVNDLDGSILRELNAFYQTPEGKAFFEKFINDPDAHVLIGASDEVLKEQISRSTGTKTTTYGATAYEFAELPMKNGQNSYFNFSNDPNYASYKIRSLNYLDLSEIQGVVHLVVFHSGGSRSDALDHLGHEVISHIMIPIDMFNGNGDDMDAEHDAYKKAPNATTPSREAAYRESIKQVLSEPVAQMNLETQPVTTNPGFLPIGMIVLNAKGAQAPTPTPSPPTTSVPEGAQPEKVMGEKPSKYTRTRHTTDYSTKMDKATKVNYDGKTPIKG